MRIVKGIVLAMALAAFGGSVTAADDNDVTAFPEIKAADASKMPLTNGKSQIAIADTDNPLVKLQKARFNTAIEEYEMLSVVINQGAYDLTFVEHFNETRRAIVAAAQDVVSKDRIEGWLVWSVAAEKRLEETVAARVALGAVRRQELLFVRRNRLEAEIALIKHRSAIACEVTPKVK